MSTRINTEKINGFLILMRSLVGAQPYGTICRLGDKEYRGAERCHLENLFYDYYDQKLPSELRQIVESEGERSHYIPFFLHYTRDYENAVKALAYKDGRPPLCELIAIHSDAITGVDGDFEFDAKKVEWLGYDVMALGGSSLIINVFFFRPHLFSRSRVLINENRLFTRAEDIDEYLDDYMRNAKQNLVEPYDRNAITTPGTERIFITITCRTSP